MRPRWWPDCPPARVSRALIVAAVLFWPGVGAGLLAIAWWAA